jgi:hypothetical protein
MLWGPQQTLASASTERAWLTNGRTVYRARFDGTTSILFEKSTDEGATFGAPVTVSASANDVMLDKPLARDAVTGRLHLLYGRSIDVGATNAILLHRYSDDEGATWSAEHVIDDGSGHGSNRFYRVALNARNGVLFLVHTSETNGVPFSTDGLWFARSTDGGATWTAIAKLYTTGIVNPIRPDCVDLPDGTLHLAWYDPGVADGTAGGDVYYARSSDSGQTWPASPTKMTTTTDYGRPNIAASGSTILMVVMKPFGSGINSDVVQFRSTDNGSTWAGPTTIATHTTGPLDHPWVVLTGQTAAVQWADHAASPITSAVIVSTDGGVTYGAVVRPLTYTGTSDAPALYTTSGFLIATGYDAGSILWARLPLFLTPPDTTRVLDNATRANAGPPPSASWSPGLTSNVGGEGLVIVSNALARAAAGGFRQGDWWNTALSSADMEAWLRVSQAAGVANDGFQLYCRLSNPGTGTEHGYAVEAFRNAGGTMDWQLLRIDTNVSYPQLGATVNTPNLLAGDIFGIQTLGSWVYVWLKTAATGDWKLLFNFNDATYAAGSYLGLELMNSQTLRVDRFGGGVLGGRGSKARITLPGRLLSLG